MLELLLVRQFAVAVLRVSLLGTLAVVTAEVAALVFLLLLSRGQQIVLRKNQQLEILNSLPTPEEKQAVFEK